MRRTGSGRLWRFQTGKGIFSTPVIDGDGNVYVGSADRTFYALSTATARCAGRCRPARSSTPPRCSTIAAGSTSARATASSTPATPPPAPRCGRSRPTRRRRPAASSTGSRATSRSGSTARCTRRTTTSSPTPSTATPRRCVGDFAPTTRPGRCPALNPRTGRLFIGNNIQLLLPQHVRDRRRHGQHGLAGVGRRHRGREPAAHGRRQGDRRRLRRLRARATTRRPAYRAGPSARATTSTPAPPPCPTARSSSRRPTAPSTRSTRPPGRCAGRSTPATRSARRPPSTATATSTSARARGGSSC